MSSTTDQPELFDLRSEEIATDKREEQPLEVDLAVLGADLWEEPQQLLAFVRGDVV